MNATHDSLVKFDRRGRLRYAPEQKARLIEAYAASGLSGPKFATLHGVNYQTFAAWLQKQKRAAVKGVGCCISTNRIGSPQATSRFRHTTTRHHS